MRPSLVILAVSLLLVSLFLSRAQGIRIKKELFSFGKHRILEAERSSLLKTSDNIGGVGDGEVVLFKDGHCSSTTTGTLKIMKRVNRVSKKSSNHWLPSIHEDYYGPRHHTPRHH